MTKQEIKNALMNYRRSPKMISEELEIIRNCETEREKFSPKSTNVSELPRKSIISDRTFSDAVNGSKYFDEEIQFHRENIIKLQERQQWLRRALQILTPVEREVIEKAFLNTDGRKVPWKVVANVIGYSTKRVEEIARMAFKKLENYKAGEYNG